jgi:hypothetical protein
MGTTMSAFLAGLPGLEGRVFEHAPISPPDGAFAVLSEGRETTLERLLDGGELVTRSVTVRLHDPAGSAGLTPATGRLEAIHALTLEAEDRVDEVRDGDLVGIFRLHSERPAYDPEARGVTAVLRFALLVMRPAEAA